MAKKKKKIEPITGVPQEDKLTIQKSKPLFALWQSDLTLSEFKILDTYLSRIDSHKPDRRAVMFEKGELEALLGVQKINKKDLEARLKHLMEHVVKLDDNGSKKGFRLVSLFEEAVAEQDDNGLWQVKLECTEKAMMYFFNIESLGYFRYKLRCITSLTSRYTYVMFTYLEYNRWRKSWEVDLDELKRTLGCDQEETYKEFKFFNVKILKKVQTELNEKTECRYTYEPIKKGRSVVAVRFTVETLPKLTFEDVDPNQYTIFDVQEGIENEEREYFCDEEFNDFTDEQLDVLRELIRHKVPEDLIESHYAVLQNRLEAYRWASADYLRRQVKVARLRKPKNLFAYVKKMLENE